MGRRVRGVGAVIALLPALRRDGPVCQPVSVGRSTGRSPSLERSRTVLRHAFGDNRYIAAYRTQSVSAITHYALVDRIEPYGEGGKYRLIFSEPATEITPIPFGNAPQGAMQGPRYTTLDGLEAARDVAEVISRSGEAYF